MYERVARPGFERTSLYSAAACALSAYAACLPNKPCHRERRERGERFFASLDKFREISSTDRGKFAFCPSNAKLADKLADRDQESHSRMLDSPRKRSFRLAPLVMTRGRCSSLGIDLPPREGTKQTCIRYVTRASRVPAISITRAQIYSKLLRAFKLARSHRSN